MDNHAFVFIYRHPDSENIITTSGLVEVVDLDVGNNYNGRPGDEEEAYSAREKATSILAEAEDWPDNKAKQAVIAAAAQLREEAEEADPAPIMGPDEYHDLALCPSCESDLTVKREYRSGLDLTPDGHELGCALYAAQQS